MHEVTPVSSPAPDVPERLRETPLVREIEFLTARARALGSGRTNALLKPFGLRVRSYAVLSLACSGARPSQREVADFLLLDPSQIVALLDGLEQRDLVTRMTDPADRRSKVIEGTDAGLELLSAATEAAQQAEDEALANLSRPERDQLRELLRRIAF